MLLDDACALRKRFTEEIRSLSHASEEPGAAVWRALELRGFCRRIPSLAGRAGDLDRLIGESLADATRALGVGRMRFSGRASDSVLRGVTSLAEIERGVLRLVAIRSAPNLSQAARRLGVALVSLSRWVDRCGRAAVFRDVARLEHDDDGAEEEADGWQGPHRANTDDPGRTAEAQRTAGPAGIAHIDGSRRSPIIARRLLRRQPWRRS